jgi:hypothetical protein
MNTQIIGYRISYLVFSIFVSCLIVFTIHKGFQKQDIITVPIFAILLFLIIDFSAKSMYQNKMEKFLTEGFDSRLLDRFKNESQEEEAHHKTRHPMEEEAHHKTRHPMEEEAHHKKPHHTMEEEAHHKAPHMEEEESFHKYAPVGDKPSEKPSSSKQSATPNGDKKAKEATDKQEERPDINKHLMDDGNNGLSNRNSETINPININVSYNNNRPFTVNDFDKNTHNERDLEGRTTDINSFRFDDGCRSGIDGINQKYFPAYLENPLNKNQPKVSNNELNKNQPKVDNNYELKMMKRILNEQNDPSPVLLENPWSEWKPLDK